MEGRAGTVRVVDRDGRASDATAGEALMLGFHGAAGFVN